MVQVRCPQCTSLVEGIEGQEAVCGRCGFKALLPVGNAPGLVAPRAAPPATADVIAPSREPGVLAPAASGTILSIWGYILGIAAVATFFLAAVGLPFAFGVAAIVVSLIGHQKEKADRRALVGLVLGVVGILAAGLWLLL